MQKNKFGKSILILVIALTIAGVLAYYQAMGIIFSGMSEMPLNVVIKNINFHLASSAIIVGACMYGIHLLGKSAYTFVFSTVVTLVFLPFFIEYFFELNQSAFGLLVTSMSFLLSIVLFFVFASRTFNKMELQK